MPGPHSYSGDDTVELQAPGHPVLLARLIDSMLRDAQERGIHVRLAGPGEFTARAFLSGRQSLLEAESVAALIAARSDDEIKAANLMRTGRLGTLAQDLAASLVGALALVEAGIDFTDEEDVVAITPGDLLARIESVIGSIEEHLDRSVGLESLQALPWVVLEGEPNAGKSTLFNTLLGRERAVVSSVRGTTRDVIAEPLRLGGVMDAEVLLVDLAGTDAVSSPIDEAMQRLAQEARARGDVIIRCLSPGEDRPAATANTIHIRTKGDLITDHESTCDLTLSAHEGWGIDELRHAVAARLESNRSSLSADAMVLAPRQEAALSTACDRLKEARCVIDSAGGDTPELVAGLLREAIDSIGEIVGVISPDDVLDQVFSTFCIGK
jgi:tRNA modification GTPase